MYHIIIESSDIGVGKSTLSSFLQKNISDSEMVEEKINTNLLDVIYSEIKNNAKQSKKLEQCEASVFLNRAQQAVNISLFGNKKVYIWDRCLVSSLAFSYNFLCEDMVKKSGFENLSNLFSNLDNFLSFSKENTTIVHIEAPLETLLERIKQRGRKAEKGITKEYLQKLRLAYNKCVWPYFGEKNIEKKHYDWQEFQKEKVLEDIKKIIQ
jgi:deoxyguanosine kinase